MTALQSPSILLKLQSTHHHSLSPILYKTHWLLFGRVSLVLFLLSVAQELEKESSREKDPDSASRHPTSLETGREVECKRGNSFFFVFFNPNYLNARHARKS